MRHNCAHHLIEELKLLRPNLVVFHGVNAREAVRAAIAPHVLRPIKEIKDTRGPVIYEWQDLSAHLLFLNHPSYNNLEKQWEPVVVPALDYLRARRLIPV
jgi:uracil-DNA glycosylase